MIETWTFDCPGVIKMERLTWSQGWRLVQLFKTGTFLYRSMVQEEPAPTLPKMDTLPWKVDPTWQVRSFHSQKDPAWNRYILSVTGKDYGVTETYKKKLLGLKPTWMMVPTSRAKKGKKNERPN